MPLSHRLRGILDINGIKIYAPKAIATTISSSIAGREQPRIKDHLALSKLSFMASPPVLLIIVYEANVPKFHKRSIIFVSNPERFKRNSHSTVVSGYFFILSHIP